MVYYLPSGAGKGTWYPRLPEPQVRDMRPLPSVELKQEGVVEDPLPVEWTRLRDGETVDNDGIYGRHFIYYRTSAYRGCMLEVGRIGKSVMNRSAADTVLVAVMANWYPLTRRHRKRHIIVFPEIRPADKKQMSCCCLRIEACIIIRMLPSKRIGR